jgi:uncharacterized membrane protein
MMKSNRNVINSNFIFFRWSRNSTSYISKVNSTKNFLSNLYSYP